MHFDFAMDNQHTTSKSHLLNGSFMDVDDLVTCSDELVLVDGRGQKRPNCVPDNCDFAEASVFRKRPKREDVSPFYSSPESLISIQNKLRVMEQRINILEEENCSLKYELDRVHSVSTLRYSQIQHLENIVIQLCRQNNLDYSNEDFTDPIFYSPFRLLPNEVILKIVRMVDCQTRKSLKQLSSWWNTMTKQTTSGLSVRCPFGMRGLAEYPFLKKLEISGICINQIDYNNGKYIQNLQVLRLHGVRVVPWEILAHLQHLQSLEITSSLIASMNGLCLLNKLENIKLNCVTVPITFPESANFTRLKRLHIQDCLELNLQYQFLQACRHLEYLHIDSPLVNPVGSIDFVSTMTRLKYFALVACCGEETLPFSVAPLKAAADTLEYLSFKGYHDLDYSEFPQMKKLKKFIPGAMSDLQFEGVLSQLTRNVHRIELHHIEDITDEGLALIPQHCPNLTQLLLIGCPQLTQNCIQTLKSLPRLTCLQLSPASWWQTFSNQEDFKQVCRNVQFDDLP